jgi:predicted ArsR family transcriptional regulator
MAQTQGGIVAVKVGHPVFDGTTGKGDHAGRRTHIIRILRDSKDPLTVDVVAKRVGLPANAARFYLESLVDAGLATRESQNRTTPGRPKVAYHGTLPNQAHEREQGYRLLAEIMAASVAQMNTEAGEWMYQVGCEWGRFITSRPDVDEVASEEEILQQLLDKLDALWFAPEAVEDDPQKIVLYNCPFLDSSRRYPQVLCQLHAGMINGSLEEMKSGYRLARLRSHMCGHRCEGDLTRSTARVAKVPLETSARPKTA